MGKNLNLKKGMQPIKLGQNQGTVIKKVSDRILEDLNVLFLPQNLNVENRPVPVPDLQQPLTSRKTSRIAISLKISLQYCTHSSARYNHTSYHMYFTVHSYHTYPYTCHTLT